MTERAKALSVSTINKITMKEQTLNEFWLSLDTRGQAEFLLIAADSLFVGYDGIYAWRRKNKVPANKLKTLKAILKAKYNVALKTK